LIVASYDNNRAIQGQVDDQDVYCRFGLKQSTAEDEFVVDSSGCQAIVKYGKLRKTFCLLVLETVACYIGLRDVKRTSINQCSFVKAMID